MAASVLRSRRSRSMACSSGGYRHLRVQSTSFSINGTRSHDNSVEFESKLGENTQYYQKNMTYHFQSNGTRNGEGRDVGPLLVVSSPTTPLCLAVLEDTKISHSRANYEIQPCSPARPSLTADGSKRTRSLLYMVFDQIALTDSESSWLTVKPDLQIHRRRQYWGTCQIVM